MGAIAVGIVGWLVGNSLDSVQINKVGKVVRNTLKQKLGSRLPRQLKSYLYSEFAFADYFKLEHGEMDYVIYPLGLRPDIPIVDLLYLEFLKHLLLTDKTGKVLIFSTPDLSADIQDADALGRFEKNVNKIFDDDDRVEVVNIFAEHPYLNVNFFERELLETIEYIGSDSFISIANAILDADVASYSDFSHHHPKGRRLLSTYHHILNVWCIRRYLDTEEILSEPQLRLGLLFWETELAKLGTLHRLQHNPDIAIVPLIGQTIHFGKNNPIPVYEPDTTLYAFGRRYEFLRKLFGRSDRELREYAHMFRTVLSENYSTSFEKELDLGRSLHRAEVLSDPVLDRSENLSNAGLRAFGLYDRLWNIYEGNSNG